MLVKSIPSKFFTAFLLPDGNAMAFAEALEAFIARSYQWII